MADVGLSSTAGAAGGAVGPSAGDVVDFASGELRLPSPPVAVAAAVAAAGQERLHRYGSVSGLHELRRAVAERLSADGPVALDADCVLVTAGTKQALFHALLAFAGPGDEVLLPAPYWTSYPAMIRLAGATPVAVGAGLRDGFKVTPQRLEAAATERTRLLVFVNPCNPSGAVYTAPEVAAIGRWAQGRGLVVLSDEIYAGLAHAAPEPVPISRAAPGLAASCLRVGGVSKTYAMTGWRVGWLAGPAEAIRVATAVQSHTSSHPSNVAQAAALAVIADGAAAWLAEVRVALARRRGLMLSGLALIPGLAVAGASDGFYAFPSVQEHLGRTIAGRTIDSSAALAELLRAEAGVAVVPGEAFGAPGHLRLNYALADEQLCRGLAQMRRVLAS